jgi:hypothetical protein
MSLKALKTTDFTLTGGKYYSPGVQIEKNGAAVQIKTTVAGTVTVERAVNGKDFTAVPDFSVSVNGLAEFNVTNAIKGQWIRVACTVEPVSCNILT